jgi:tetratricopeptide (TPR) repeat protein
LSISLYANTWSFGFASDDTMMIVDNSFTKGGFDGIKKIFTTDAFAGFLGEGKNLLSGGRYRPLSQLIFNIEYSIFGLNSHLWHIQNTIFFAIGMLIVFFTLRKLFQNEEFQWSNIAFLSTLLLISHPLNTEVVANIKSFDLILSLIFSFLALNLSLKYYDSGKAKYLLGIFIYLFLGILSKETALTFLGVIPLSVLVFRKFNKQRFIITFGVSLISVISYFVFRTIMIGLPKSVEVTELLNNPFLQATTTEKYATILYTWWHYIQLFLLPINLTHDYYPYTIALKNFSDPFVILGFLLYVSLTIWSFYKIFLQLFKSGKPNLLAYSWIFYIFVFSVSSNIFVSIGAFMNERFIFIADIGLTIFATIILKKIALKIRPKKQQIVYLLLLPIVILFSIKTVYRNQAWKNDYTLFTTDVQISNNSAKCNVSAGGKSYEKAKKEFNAAKKKQLLNNAEKYLLKGIKIHPKYVAAYVLLGNVYFEKEDYKKSLQSYITSVKLGERKDAPANIKSLGIKLHQINKYQESLQVFDFYSKMFSSDSEVNYFIADNYLNLNQVDTSILILNKLIKSDSLYDEAYNKLGEIYGRYKNNLAASEYYLIKGYEINPKNASICENLGVLNGIRGNAEQSIYYFEKALKLMDKPNKQIYQNIAASYSKLGNEAKANEFIMKAQNMK